MAQSFYNGEFYGGEFYNTPTPPTPSSGKFFDGQFFGGGFFGSETPVPTGKPQEGGPGGSNKAGKKKHHWERRGHVISAIQSPPPWLIDELPDDTPAEEFFTAAVEEYIVEQELEVQTLDKLIEATAVALQELHLDEVKRIQAKAYNEKLRTRIKLRKRREEEGIMHILMLL